MLATLPNILTIARIALAGSGADKATLAEAVLHPGQRAGPDGRADDSATRCDYDPEEEAATRVWA